MKRIVQFGAIINALILSLLLASCSEGASTESNIIDIDNAVREQALFSDHFTITEMIPLETNEEVLIGPVSSLYLLENELAVITSGQCLLFDRASGKFLRSIGMQGRGENEYNSLPQGHIIDEEQGLLLANRGDSPIAYSLATGEAISPNFSTQLPDPRGGLFMPISDGLWVQANMNLSGDLEDQLIFFDREKIVSAVENRYHYTLQGNNVFVDFKEIGLYRYDDESYFKFLYCDTLYNITNQRLEPQWIFKTANSMGEIVDQRGDMKVLAERASDYHRITGIMECDESIHFTSFLQGEKRLYQFKKQGGKVTLVDGDGFIYDEQSSVRFWPMTTAQDGAAAALYESFTLLEEMATDGSVTPMNPEYERLKAFASQLNADDNPVIIVAKQR